MVGIDLNEQIEYKHASLRHFAVGEHHISRCCSDDVLVMVYRGVLRFTEDGECYEICPGQYHIQRAGSVQSGDTPSDAPQYLYVHFRAKWTDCGANLPKCGTFDVARFRPMMDELDALAHGKAAYIAQAAKFYAILMLLTKPEGDSALAASIRSYIESACGSRICLDDMCSRFHYSKNYIIHICKKAFGMTPVAYIQHVRLRKAESLMEITSDPLESIAAACGFPNYSHFYKLFRREHGISPEQWRKKKRIG